MHNSVQNVGDTGRNAWIHLLSAAIQNNIMELIMPEMPTTISGMGSKVILRAHVGANTRRLLSREAALREGKATKGKDAREV